MLTFEQHRWSFFNSKHFSIRGLKVVEIVEAGNTDMKESWIWRADYKLYYNFPLYRMKSLTPTLGLGFRVRVMVNNELTFVQGSTAVPLLNHLRINQIQLCHLYALC